MLSLNYVQKEWKSSFNWSYKLHILGDDYRAAKILISIVVVFVVCQSFTIVADIYEAVICIQQNVEQSMCISNDHIENIIDISHFMLSINSSVNFLLYAAQDDMFRNALFKVKNMNLFRHVPTIGPFTTSWWKTIEWFIFFE